LAGIFELLRDHRAGMFRHQFMGAGDGALHALGRFGQLDLRAQDHQHLAPFQRHGFRHHQDQLVALGGGNEGQCDAGVAAGRLDQHILAGRDDALFFQRIDHADADTVLDRGNRIEEFQLEQDIGLGAGFGGHALDPHQGGVADGLGDGVVDASAARFALFHDDSPCWWSLRLSPTLLNCEIALVSIPASTPA
jgi:hypothetical protein